MRPVKRIVKRVIWAVVVTPVVLYVLFYTGLYVGLRWGFTPLPKPPSGVRLEPLKPLLARNDLKPDNGAYYYMKAAELLLSYKQSDDSRDQMEALLANDTSGDAKEIRQTLTDCREALDLVRNGSQMSLCQMPWLEPSTISTSLLKSMRQLGRLLIADGKLAEQAGDFNRAIADYLVVVKLGRDCTAGGTLIMSLVGAAITELGTQAARTWVLRNATSPGALQIIMEKLGRINSELIPYAETLRYELEGAKKWIERDMLNQMKPTDRKVLSKREMFTYLDAAYGDYIQDAAKPVWESDPKAIEDKWGMKHAHRWLWTLNRPAPRIFIGMVLPALERPRGGVIRVQLGMEVTMVVCALRAYTLTNGHPPEQLSELVPGLVPAIPIDPYDGKPLRYRREGEGWVVWSVGSDRKDDNAQWHEFKYRAPKDNRVGGDIYFKSTEPEDDLAFYKAGLVRSNSASTSTQ